MNFTRTVHVIDDDAAILNSTSAFLGASGFDVKTYGSAQDFRSKFGTFHYLSFNATKWLNIGVFESVIWQGNDPNRQRAYDINYLNPLIFFRPVEYSLGSADNSMLGFSFKIRLNENNQLYGQLLLDEFYLKENSRIKSIYFV